MQMGHDILNRHTGNQANVDGARCRLLGFGLELLSRFMQVEFLLAKRQGLTSFAKCDDVHAQHTSIEVTGPLKVANGQNKVVDPVDLHGLSLVHWTLTIVRFIEPLLWPRPTTAHLRDLSGYNTSPHICAYLKDTFEQSKQVTKLAAVAHELHAESIQLERFDVPWILRKKLPLASQEILQPCR